MKKIYKQGNYIRIYEGGELVYSYNIYLGKVVKGHRFSFLYAQDIALKLKELMEK